MVVFQDESTANAAPLPNGSSMQREENATVSKSVRAILDAAKDLEQQAWKAHTLDAPQAVALAKEALALLRALSGDAVSNEQVLLESQVYFALGSAQERLSDYDGAFQSGQESLLRAERIGASAADDETDAFCGNARDACMKSYNLLGNVCDRRGDYAAALEYRQADHDLAMTVGNSPQQAHALLRLGGSYFRLGDYPAALNLFLQARDLFDLMDYAGLGSTWNDIGNVWYSENHYEKALEAYQTGLAQFQHTDDPYWRAGLLSNIAGVYLKQDNTAEARKGLEQSLRLREAVGDRHGQGYSLTSLVEVLRREGDFDLARTYGLRALSLFEQIGDQAGQALARLHLAEAEVDKGHWDTAERYLNESLNYTEAQGMREVSYQIHAEMSRLYEKKGDMACALAHYQQFHTIKEALLNETTRTRLRNLEVVHRVAQANREAAQAHREADLLRRHNESLSLANARQVELLTQLQQQKQALETLSRTDSLTGLSNRRCLEEQFRVVWETVRQQQQPLAVALLDLDHFKQINDRFSHQMGDTVLQIVARLLAQNCRETDLVARYGGEEFVIVIPGMTLQAASQFCDQIRRRIDGYPWHELHPDLHVTLSIGLCGNGLTANPEQMLSRADARLYEAKAAGRNRVYA